MDAQEQCDRVASGSKQYLVDKNLAYAQVVQEKGDVESIVYTHGDDLISQERGGVYSSSMNYYHYDGLGSTRSLTDSLGQITDSYDYNAYGTVLDQAGSTANNYLYTGEQFDAALGNYYLRARYYNPNFGNFTQMDTWPGLDIRPLSLNKYIYTEGDPINGFDPSGNMTLTEFGVAMTGLVILAAATDYVIRFNMGSDSLRYGVTTINDYSELGGDKLRHLVFSKGGKQQGRNYVTEKARSEAKGMGMTLCEYYKWLKEQPEFKGNPEKIRDIEQAEKYDGCRNKQKRRSHYGAQ